MKALILFVFFGFSAIAANAQSQGKLLSTPDPTQEIVVAEAACGQCKFDLAGAGCDLAVRINGKAYFVDGTSIDAHGDAHAADGFCQAIRQAKVQGKLVDNVYHVSYFSLLPTAPAAPKKQP